MIVVDTNLLAYFHIPGPLTGTADWVYQKDPAWFAPRLWRHEFRNVLATHMRLGKMTLDQALDIGRVAEAQMEGRDGEPGTTIVLALAESSGATAYDCEFIAMAEQHGVSLVTFDTKLEARFPGTAISPTKFLGR